MKVKTFVAAAALLLLSFGVATAHKSQDECIKQVTDEVVSQLKRAKSPTGKLSLAEYDYITQHGITRLEVECKLTEDDAATAIMNKMDVFGPNDVLKKTF